MTDLEKQVFKKLTQWVLKEVNEKFSNSGCNDLDEKVLNLTTDEKQIALAYLEMVDKEEDNRMYPAENIYADYQVSIIISAMLKMYFDDKDF